MAWTKIKLKKCRDKDCDNEFMPFNTLQKYCSYNCTKRNQKPVKRRGIKPIPKFSDKRKKENAIYLKERLAFLDLPENKICFIDGCKEPATTIEHRAGRIGSNYLNKEYWAGCCLEHNLELERNPILSKHYQLSKLHHGAKI